MHFCAFLCNCFACTYFPIDETEFSRWITPSKFYSTGDSTIFPFVSVEEKGGERKRMRGMYNLKNIYTYLWRFRVIVATCVFIQGRHTTLSHKKCMRFGSPSPCTFISRVEWVWLHVCMCFGSQCCLLFLCFSSQYFFLYGRSGWCYYLLLFFWVEKLYKCYMR